MARAMFGGRNETARKRLRFGFGPGGEDKQPSHLIPFSEPEIAARGIFRLPRFQLFFCLHLSIEFADCTVHGETL